MPQPCDKHQTRPEVSCPICFPDEELRIGIQRLQAVSPPSAPTRKKPKRLDAPKDPNKTKRASWKDELFGDD